MKHKIYADLDDIVFEGRQKNYGAFMMRRRYNKILVRASLLTFLLFLSMTGMPKIIRWLIPGEAVELISTDTIQDTFVFTELPDIEEIEEIEQPPEPPAPTPPEPPKAIATTEFAVIEPSDEDDAIDKTITEIETLIDELDSSAIGYETREGDAFTGTEDLDWSEIAGTGDGPNEVQPIIEEDPPFNEPFFGEQPRAINMEEFKKSVGYPQMAREIGAEGKVMVRALIGKTGRIEKHKITKNPHNILSRAVEEKLDMLIFTPGIANNKKPAKVWINIPINFTLRN